MDNLINDVSNYLVVEGNTAHILTEKVNSLLEDSWLLYGQPYVSPYGKMYQAMVKPAPRG